MIISTNKHVQPYGPAPGLDPTLVTQRGWLWSRKLFDHAPSGYPVRFRVTYCVAMIVCVVKNEVEVAQASAM